MVKADVKRDYYADLEIPPTADLEEIKRQFRLLAKQYHPDRNPGHEVEVVPKFQAVQAAHEVLSDPTERAKYDAGRAKLARQNAPAPPPPPQQQQSSARDGDPYNFRKPAMPKMNTTSTNFPFPPPPQTPQQHQTPRHKGSFGSKPQQQPSAGAEKFSAFARPAPQTWDRQRFEDQAKAEAAQRFHTMRTPTTPQPPPRPPRPHPTAPKSASAAPSPDLPHPPNGVGPGFPGLNRAASARRTHHGQTEDPPRTSAYAYVRGDRPPPTNQQTYVPEAYNVYSPPLSKARTHQSPLRHTKSSEQGIQPDRPNLERSSSKYASNTGEKTNINGLNIGRSASVRNSPIDKTWEERGPFGRPTSQYAPPPTRHRSASPKIKPTINTNTSNHNPPDFSSSSGSSGDERTKAQTRPKVNPRQSRMRAATNDGLEGHFPSTNYTRVVEQKSEQYHYPAPEPKQPVRYPFPDMTSPDDTIPPIGGFSNGTSNIHPTENVFRPAQFSAEDWTERLKSQSPTKRGSKSKRANMPRSADSPDAMDIDPQDTMYDKRPQPNGVDLNDLKKEAPFTAAGLDNVDDLATNLPFESKASARVPLERGTSARVRQIDLPRPPKTVIPPSEDRLTQENWSHYVRNMNEYMRDWLIFNGKMIAHFQSRHEQVSKGMSENWMSMKGDGPTAEQCDANGVGLTNNDTVKAGFAAYMAWLDDDVVCHAWWDRANEMHRACLEDLGRLRDSIRADWN